MVYLDHFHGVLPPWGFGALRYTGAAAGTAACIRLEGIPGWTLRAPEDAAGAKRRRSSER